LEPPTDSAATPSIRPDLADTLIMSDATEDDHLFPVARLKELLNDGGEKFDRFHSDLLSRNLLLRPLRITDHGKGYMQLLSQHTTAGDVPYLKFAAQFRRMQAYGDVYYIVVVEDLATNRIIATGTLEVRKKSFHLSGSFLG